MSLTSRRLAATLSLTIGAFLVLTACGGSDSGGSASSGSASSGSASSGSASGSGSSEDSFVVGISTPQGAQPILKATVDAFTAAAELDGITVKTLDAQLDPSKQVTDIDQFVAQQVDAIVVYPLDANSLTPALDRAEKAGIYLIGWAAITNSVTIEGALLFAIVLFEVSQSWLVRIGGALVLVLQSVAVVATANHFLFDALAGVVISLAALAVAYWLDRSGYPKIRDSLQRLMS